VALSTLTIRYWYTLDAPIDSEASQCDFAQLGCSNVTLSNVTLSPDITQVSSQAARSATHAREGPPECARRRNHGHATAPRASRKEHPRNQDGTEGAQAAQVAAGETINVGRPAAWSRSQTQAGATGDAA
jgi:hypothetical protein